MQEPAFTRRGVIGIGPADAAIVGVVRRGFRAARGELMFDRSDDCCYGSASTRRPAWEFLVGGSDVQPRLIEVLPFSMRRAQFAYRRRTQRVIDALSRNGGMVSLEGPAGATAYRPLPALCRRRVAAARRQWNATATRGKGGNT